MADLVVGLAKTTVEAALTKVKAAIEEEAKLRQRARQNMVFITLELEMIHSFLDDATEERVKCNLVKTWVRQVCELAYDLEDVMDFVVHLDNKFMSTLCLRLLPSCIAPSQILDEVVEEMEEMRARVEELSKSYLRYSHIMDFDPKLFRLQEHISSGAAAGAVAVTMLMKARDATERQPCFRDLAQLITRKGVQDLQVISVWETVDGDLSTTSIISKAYNDLSFVPYFTCRAWVKLMHPFNPRDFIRSLVAQFCSNSCKESTMVRMDVLTKLEATHEDLAKEFEQLVTHERYLVILEDLSNMVEWHAIRMFLPDMNNGSCIIVSTQRFEIASLCVGHPYQLTELKQFSAEHSVCALFKEGSQGNGQRGDEQMVCGVRQSSSYKKLQSKSEAAYDCGMHISPLVGRELETDGLLQYATIELLSPSKVISVWGMAGVGKSALVRNLYNDRISEQFSNYSWVDVLYPFNLNDFCRSILLDIRSEKDPVEECHQLLNNHRCLLVIDDLQTTREWDMIQTALLFDNSKSVIIVITSDARVATYCASKEELVFHVKSLENDPAIDLFKTEVHRKNPSSFLMDHSGAELQELVLKCGGLPKVIVAVADVLAGQEVIRTDIVHSLNERFIHHLETKPEYDNLRGLFAWMDFIFRACPDALKPCIFYLSIFRADLSIRRRRLVRRWIAEGYSRDKHEESAEENGEKYFSNLLELSLVQQPSDRIGTASPGDTSMVKCQVNGFIHEYIVSRRMEENFVFELRGRCVLTTRRTGRHLIIQSSWDRDRTVYRSIDFSRLRSLTVFGMWTCFFLSENMRLLRVLDLENAHGVLNDDVECMVVFLPRLKFLSLRGCMKVTRLPDSLGAMRQLETLDVRHTSIVELPPAVITKLHKLQYIRAGTSHVPLDQDHDTQPPAPADHDGMSTSQTSAAVSVNGEVASTSQPAAETPPVAVDGRTSTPLVPWWRKALVESYSCCWSSKKEQRGRQGLSGWGVEIPVAGIGILTALHTLGVVRVSGTGGKAILREVKELTQLRKLGLSGINRRNWQDLCLALCGHNHLESLSVLFDDEQAHLYYLGDISNPPKTLKSLKLYGGNVHVSPIWMKQLDNLQKVHLELTMSTQEDIDSLMELSYHGKFRHLCVKPIQDGVLRYGRFENWWNGEDYKAPFLKIDCGSYKVAIVFGRKIPEYVEVLVIHCSSTTGSSLELSEVHHLQSLKEVWLKGSYSDAVKQHLQEIFAWHHNKPVLKLYRPHSAPTPPFSC